MKNNDFSAKNTAKKVALVGISAATLECGKLALAALPNIEVVTLLSALYGYVFGSLGVLSALVFVCIEPLIYGVGTWLPLYFIYWPLVAAVFMLLGKKNVENRVILTAFALVLTVIFGFLSALIDVGLFSGYFDNFFYRFGIYYMRGIPFYIAQTVTNAVLFPAVFLPLAEKLKKINIYSK